MVVKHPKYGFIYTVNYGYIPNTISGDGEELDAYVLGEHKPLDTFEGEVIAIIHRTNDYDDKLVLMAKDRKWRANSSIDKISRTIFYFWNIKITFQNFSALKIEQCLSY